MPDPRLRRSGRPDRPPPGKPALTPDLIALIGRLITAGPKDRPPLIGIAGSQGSGKTTLARAAAEAFGAVQVSLDDVYLTKAERAAMARDVRPLFAVRGPPGTHDLDLLERTISALSAAGPEDETPIPVFDKLADDRMPEGQWRTVRGRPSAILIDGWCLGALPDTPEALSHPLNPLERERDPDGVWRRAVNGFTGDRSLALAERLDARLFLKAPGFDTVLDWRCEQEAGLRGRTLTPEERAGIADFIQYFERLTRRMIDGGVLADVTSATGSKPSAGHYYPMSFQDRRFEVRAPANARGVVVAPGLEMPCVIADVSGAGLKVRLDRQMALPKQVQVVDIAQGVAIEADLAWAKGNEAGFKRTGQSSLRGLTPSRLAAARAAWMRAGGR